MIGQLRIENGSGRPQRVAIEDRPLVLGGGPSVDVHVDDDGVAREHCRLEVVGHQLVVTDLGSTGGTYVRGQRIDRLAIDVGESFVAGSTRVTFEASSNATTLTRSGGARWNPSPATPPRPRKRVSVPANPSMIEGYRILRRLGAGSMGTAYLARSLESGGEVVLKTIQHRGHAKTPIFFIREAQMGSKLRHPNIVPVVDFGESGGLLFLAMEYVSGGSLLDRIERQGMLDSSEALGQMLQLTDALDHASRKKFVHRDIKPANILLTPDGVPKLADFGLAKMLSETQHAQLTRSGEARGTPMYMPPEALVSAADADTRGDIYSLGVTYYHALAGGPPFPADSLAEVLRKVVECEPEPIEARNPRVDPELAAVIRRMMRKHPEDRYPGTAELARDLARVFESARVRSTTPAS